MIKFVSILKRPLTMNADEFRSWWLGPHQAIGKRIPGIKKYVISLAVNTQAEGQVGDGMVELWFDSMDDADRAMASPVYKEARNDLKQHNITAVTRMFTEEHDII